MSRATDTLLAVAETLDEKDGGDATAANDEISGELETEGMDLVTWIDALALTLAAGIRVGARGLDHAPVANDPIPADDLARRVAKELRRLDDERASVAAIGVSSRKTKEKVWRDARSGSASRGPTSTEIDGESTWSISEATRLLSRTKPKRKRGR